MAVGWQIYALTSSAFDLGMVGLVQFIPTALLVFVAGHAADRYDRKRVVQICQIAEGLTAAFLAWGSFAGWLNVPEIFAAVVLFGTATAFESPAAAAAAAGRGAGGDAAEGHGALHRGVSGGDDQRSGAGRPRLRGGARRALRGDGGVLVAGGDAERGDQARTGR